MSTAKLAILKEEHEGEIDYNNKEENKNNLDMDTIIKPTVRHVLSEIYYESNIMFMDSTSLLNSKHMIESPQPQQQLMRSAMDIKPGSNINPEKHFYPNVINTNIHPIAKSFFNLGNQEILERYLQLHPTVKRDVLQECLQYKPKYFFWAGSDLFHVRTNKGEKKMIIVETNSCPAGQKSMPSKNDDKYSGYRTVLESAFKYIQKYSNQDGGGDLAIIYDKNEMEVNGYGTILSEISNERVWMIEYYENDKNPPIKWYNNTMYVRDTHCNWHSIRACFRYVTQKPWNRIPMNSRTLIMNNIIACLCGGRNKSMAAHAYKLLNEELNESGLKIYTPETILNLEKEDIPKIIENFGGKGVIKVPYSNAGQGVYTIMNMNDLNEFMRSKQYYEKYLVQSLVEPYAWFHYHNTKNGYNNIHNIHNDNQYYHIGTVPNKNNKSYVNDIRMMVCSGENGFEPISIYSRRARKHIESSFNIDNDSSSSSSSSWDMLGTNLSIKINDESWNTDSNRLILVDKKDFHKLNLHLNDLIDAYIQTVLSVIAIDKLCYKLIDTNGEFNHELFKELNPDKILLNEIRI